MLTYTLQRTSAADMETVFDLLTDHVGYARISAPRKVELEREGNPDRNGVGAIRALHIGWPPIREEVTLYDRPGRFGYKVLSGLPVKSQTGEVTLSHTGGGTHIAYTLKIEPAFGPLGAAMARTVMRLAIAALLRDVAKAAEKQAATA